MPPETVNTEPETTYNARPYEPEAALLELPRAFGLKTSDLGIAESDYAAMAADYAAGGEHYEKEAKLVLNVLLEMMSRTKPEVPRVYTRNDGTPILYVMDNGREREAGKHDRGGYFKTFACSRWAAKLGRDDRCTSTGTDAPPMIAGQHKRDVEENFAKIMPLLKFASDTPDMSVAMTDPNFNENFWKAKHAESVSDNSLRRKKLKEWLTPFLKNPVCKWNGEV